MKLKWNNIQLKTGMTSHFDNIDNENICWWFTKKKFSSSFELDLKSSKILYRLLKELYERKLTTYDIQWWNINIDLTNMKVTICFERSPILMFTFDSNDLRFCFDFELTQKECYSIATDLDRYIKVLEDEEWKQVRNAHIRHDNLDITNSNITN